MTTKQKAFKLLFFILGLFALAIGIIFYQLDSAFDGIIVECNKPPISSENFEKLCNNITPGQDIRNHVHIIGSSLEYSSCKEEACTLEAQGGVGMFCDFCIIEYNKETYEVINAEWVFGDT